MDGGVGKGRGSVRRHKTVDMIDVGMAQERGGDLVRGDTNPAETFHQPAEAWVLHLAKSGVDDGDFVSESKHQEVNVKGKSVRRFAHGGEGVFHFGAFFLRMHQTHRIAEIAFAVANGKGVDLSNAKVIDGGVLKRKDRLAVRSENLVRARGQDSGAPTQSQAPDKPTARPFDFPFRIVIAHGAELASFSARNNVFYAVGGRFEAVRATAENCRSQVERNDSRSKRTGKLRQTFTHESRQAEMPVFRKADCLRQLTPSGALSASGQSGG